jgi:hypothetical protein
MEGLVQNYSLIEIKEESGDWQESSWEEGAQGEDYKYVILKRVTYLFSLTF